MKANDFKYLMLGDLLRHENGKVYKVTKVILLNDGNYHFACGTPHLWEYNNYFYPIPLTFDILDKNDKDLPKDSSIYVRGFYNFGDGVLVYDISIKNSRTSLNTSIQYVHEFQHALKQCDIYKEVKL